MSSAKHVVPASRLIQGAAAVVLSLAIGFVACGKAPEQAAETPPPPAPSPVERGQYLVTAGGCNDCHTPFHMGPNGPEPDMSRFLSGHPQDMAVGDPPNLGTGPWMVAATHTFTAWAGPWGISFSANITPDTTTGIGAWSDDMFIQAMRTGKHMGSGRDILPPMPWVGYGKLTDDDLKAMLAYLKSVPAIANQVPEPVPPKS